MLQSLLKTVTKTQLKHPHPVLSLEHKSASEAVMEMILRIPCNRMAALLCQNLHVYAHTKTMGCIDKREEGADKTEGGNEGNRCQSLNSSSLISGDS